MTVGTSVSHSRQHQGKFGCNWCGCWPLVSFWAPLTAHISLKVETEAVHGGFIHPPQSLPVLGCASCFLWGCLLLLFCRIEKLYFFPFFFQKYREPLYDIIPFLTLFNSDPLPKVLFKLLKILQCKLPQFTQFQTDKTLLESSNSTLDTWIPVFSSTGKLHIPLLLCYLLPKSTKTLKAF